MNWLRLGFLGTLGLLLVNASSAEAQSANEIPPPPGSAQAPTVVVAADGTPPPIVVVEVPLPAAYAIPAPPVGNSNVMYDATGVALSATPTAPTPSVTGPRSGFAFQLGQGFGSTIGARRDGFAFDFAFGLGGYVSPTFALFGRIGGAVGGDGSRAAGIAGATFSGQHWLADRWMLGYGIGVGSVERGDFSESSDSARFLFEFRSGFAFAHWTHHSLMLVLNLRGGAAQNGVILIPTLSFEWQVH